MDVEIKSLPDTRVAYMRHLGPYGESGITRTWQRFAAWCAARGLMHPRRPMFGISHDNPELTAPEKCRYDACVEVEPTFHAEGEVGIQTIPGGRYACAAFAGTSADVADAWTRFFGEWLPESHYRFDERLVLELYDTDFVMDEESGAFTCQLCMPVRPL